MFSGPSNFGGFWCTNVAAAAGVLVLKCAGFDQLSDLSAYLFGGLVALLLSVFVCLVAGMTNEPYLRCLPIRRYEGNVVPACWVQLWFGVVDFAYLCPFRQRWP